LKSALPLLLVAGLFEVNQRATVIILGTLSGPRDAGIFSIASLIAALISFILLAANTALGPVISSLYTSNEISRLQNILTRSARITFLIALVMALALTLLRQWVLLLFGQEFLQIGTLLGILIIGYLFSVAAGSVGMILIMTGREKYTLTPIAVSAVVTILLNVIWIPRWGIEGAGLATIVGMISGNILLVIQVRRLLGIDATVLGRL
ncbi:MAG: polysaccharide biosynthesis C-terminal domain-containing protein, partial [Candidatus Promineifilaceae bacterium]|nr:polysaccharide biosynthesis C-terminal domain-containing protein [Candidatus Promineifilaceae bacterium]